MKRHNLLFLFVICSYSNLLFGQCNFITPAEITKIDYANREVTFSDCIINGENRTVVYVQKGESIDIQVKMKVARHGDYCPSCIVQIYWGINNYVSTCAISFYGFTNGSSKSKQKFKAPDKDGVYYVTMGGTLDYSCQNNLQRPVCDPKSAFAVVVVGTPDPEKKMTLNFIDKTNDIETTLLKSGCFGQMTELKWYRDGTLLKTENTNRISTTIPGTYRAVWKNCVGDSVYMEKKMNTASPKKDTTSLDYQLDHSNKFILRNLQFAVQSSVLTEDSKKELDLLAKILNDKPTIKIQLQGHTDIVGSTSLNLKLSEQRVQAVKKYLVQKGIDGKRISTKGFGGTRPLTKGSTEEEHKKNRRVEIVILSR